MGSRVPSRSAARTSMATCPGGRPRKISKGANAEAAAMPWELHQPAELGARHGREEGVRRAERLKALLGRNGLSPPRFPGMVWAEDRLPDGTAVAVGIAE